MTVTPETAQALSNTFVRVTKVIGSMKSHMPITRLLDVPGLDHSHFPALFTLGHEPRRVSALAEAIHSDVSTVSRQVTHLASIGLVEKIDDPDDGRAQLLSLTPRGGEVIAELVARRGEWFGQLMKHWDEADATAFLAQLQRFGDDIETFKAEMVAAHHHPALADAGDTSQTTHDLQTQEH